MTTHGYTYRMHVLALQVVLVGWVVGQLLVAVVGVVVGVVVGPIGELGR